LDRLGENASSTQKTKNIPDYWRLENPGLFPYPAQLSSLEKPQHGLGSAIAQRFGLMCALRSVQPLLWQELVPVIESILAMV
jgi:hypothetical protein